MKMIDREAHIRNALRGGVVHEVIHDEGLFAARIHVKNGYQYVSNAHWAYPLALYRGVDGIFQLSHGSGGHCVDATPLDVARVNEIVWRDAVELLMKEAKLGT